MSSAHLFTRQIGLIWYGHMKDPFRVYAPIVIYRTTDCWCWIDKIIDAERALYEQNMPPEGMWAVLPEWMHENLRSDKRDFRGHGDERIHEINAFDILDKHPRPLPPHYKQTSQN